MFARSANSAQAIRAGLVILWAAVVWTSARVGVPAALRASLVIPILSYCPGWLLLRALRIRLSGLEAVLFSIALSWAVLIACGLVLHLYGALSEIGWLIATSVAMAAFALVPSPVTLERQSALTHRPRWDIPAVAGFLLALALASGAIALSGWHERNYRPFGVLELWMIPGDSPGELRVGVHNGDPRERAMRLEIRGERRLIHAGAPMVLAPDRTVTRTFTIRPAGTGTQERIEALLFDNGGRLLRRTHVTVGEPAEAVGTAKGREE